MILIFILKLQRNWVDVRLGTNKEEGVALPVFNCVVYFKNRSSPSVHENWDLILSTRETHSSPKHSRNSCPF